MGVLIFDSIFITRCHRVASNLREGSTIDFIEFEHSLRLMPNEQFIFFLDNTIASNGGWWILNNCTWFCVVIKIRCVISVWCSYFSPVGFLLYSWRHDEKLIYSAGAMCDYDNPSLLCLYPAARICFDLSDTELRKCNQPYHSNCWFTLLLFLHHLIARIISINETYPMYFKSNDISIFRIYDSRGKPGIRSVKSISRNRTLLIELHKLLENMMKSIFAFPDILTSNWQVFAGDIGLEERVIKMDRIVSLMCICILHICAMGR